MNQKTLDAFSSTLLASTALPRGMTLQRKCACGTHTKSGGNCESCSEKDDRILSRRAVLSADVNEVPSVVHDVLRTPGEPLDASTRAFMEPRFGHDFSHVRLHTDAKSAESARAVNALAYTVGNDVVFGATQYSPGTENGHRLLAHELGHVMQQQGASRAFDRQLAVGKPDTEYERDADAMAESVLSENRSPTFSTRRSPVQIQREGPADAGVSPDAGTAKDAGTPKDAGVDALPPPKPAAVCTLPKPEDCKTYGEWLGTFPAPASSADANISAVLPSDLQKLLQGKLGQSGNLPDCADVALLLRHHYLKARGLSFSFKVGRDVETADTFTLGKATTDKEIKACMIGAGTESFQETRSAFALVSFYKTKGKNTLNLKQLLAAGLKIGDMFVWKRRPEIKGNFQGHAQTVQIVTPPKPDPKDATKVITEGSITLVQGNMEGGRGKGELQQRFYTFTELTGKPDGDADIVFEPRHAEEFFFGAGPWKG